MAESRTSLEQITIDALAEASLRRDQDSITKIGDFLGYVKSLDPDFLTAIQRRWNAHQYANNSFSRHSTIQDNDIVLDMVQALSPAAARLLLAIETIAIRQYIQLSVNDCTVLLRTKDRDHASKALRELSDLNILITIVEHKGRRPGIYKLNTSIVRTGRTDLSDDDMHRYIGAELPDGMHISGKDYLIQAKRKLDLLTTTDPATGNRIQAVCLAKANEKEPASDDTDSTHNVTNTDDSQSPDNDPLAIPDEDEELPFA